MTILAIGSFGQSRFDELVEAAGDHTVTTITDVADINGSDNTVEALIGVTGTVDPVLDRLPQLRWIHSGAAGVDATLTPRLRASPIELTSATGNGAIPLAEHAAMLMLMLDRDAPRWARAQTEHRWDRFTHDELYGKTLGVIGLGHSGTHLAGIAHALGMTVLALSRRSRPHPRPHVAATYAPPELHSFLSRCDVVVITAPHTPETAGLIDAAALASMRPGAHLICISRGGIIDDDALLHALDEGHIGGAGLDAHTVEPLPAESPFWSHPRVIVTPHNGATTAQTAERGRKIVLDNLRRFVAARPLVNLVDKESGY
ncbi:MAG TPA: D-2-hydroxyacid dehydrogenase [Microlunatus sp.]